MLCVELPTKALRESCARAKGVGHVRDRFEPTVSLFRRHQWGQKRKLGSLMETISCFYKGHILD